MPFADIISMKIKKTYSVATDEYEAFKIICDHLCIDRKRFMQIKIQQFIRDHAEILREKGYIRDQHHEQQPEAPARRTKWIETE